MGGVAHAPRGAAPTLLVHAAKDALGANLDRVQVVKGWLDSAGRSHERVYERVVRGREPGSDGKLPAVGSSVNLAAAGSRIRSGRRELATVWTTPTSIRRRRRSITCEC